jgi:hypothetical protein
MRRSLLLLCPLIVAAFTAAAQNNIAMKPGLWEMHQKPELPPEQQAKMEQAQKAMASMPPEQRAMIEKMMAQKGVSMDMNGGTITIKTCLSKEQAEKNIAPVTDAKNNCTHDVKRSGNTIHTHAVCTDPESVIDSDVTLTSDGFTNKARIVRQRNGKPETITVTGDARWLGSDCGGLKPVGTTP